MAWTLILSFIVNATASVTLILPMIQLVKANDCYSERVFPQDRQLHNVAIHFTVTLSNCPSACQRVI